MSDRIRNLQMWIDAHGIPLAPDGKWGPETRNAVIEVFRNRNAPAATLGEINDIAARHGFDRRAMMAVAKVESGGSGWDDTGLLKCLWERHWLWRRVRQVAAWTGARQAFLSIASPGGYTNDADGDGINDSWEKLADATGLFGFNVAAECASYGKFQVMGGHWKALGYPSVADMIWGLSRREAAHYELFARYIVTNGLTKALNRVDGDPENARKIAAGYNGGNYERYSYHFKIASAWRALG